MSQIPVEVIGSEGGKAGINDLVKGWIESGSPGTDYGCFTASCATGKKTKALGFGQIIQPEQCFLTLIGIDEDFLGIL